MTFEKKLQWNLDQNTKSFIIENASENVVCEIAAILFAGVGGPVCAVVLYYILL